MVFNQIKERVQNNVGKNLNLAKTLITNPTGFVDALKYGNYEQLPYSFRTMLQKIGHEKITSLTAVRAPISNVLTNLLNGLSGFTLKRKLKSTPYDKLFHLALRINGKYDMEKEQSVKLAKAFNRPDQETLDITDFPRGLTIAQFVENAIKHVGIRRITHYDGRSTNCQVFILDLLHGSGIHDNNADNWMKHKTRYRICF